MARVAERLGVEIRCDVPVEEMLFEGRRAVGVRTQYGEERAGCDRAERGFCPRDEAPGAGPVCAAAGATGKIRGKKFSCSTFMMYLGVEGTFDLPHHTIHIAEDYERNLDEIENQHVLSDDPSFYVQNACVTDPIAGAARQAARSTCWRRSRISTQTSIGRSEKRALSRENAAPDREGGLHTTSSGAFALSGCITPADWDAQYEIHQGATFNLAHSLDQMLHLRPHNRFEDVDGMYLVGGGTHPGSGLPVIFESARISSRLVLEDLGYSAEPVLATSSVTPMDLEPA